MGEFSLNYDDVLLTTVNTPRLQSLLTYLVLHRHAPQSRQHLAFLLWPDLPEARARANLRRQLHQLQHTLPDADHYLIADAQTLRWRPASSFSLDVGEFEQAASRTQSLVDLQRAIELYRGDLLPGCYDDWIVPERERLKQMLIETLGRLLQFAADKGDYPAAINYAQRLLQIDPLHEEIHRRLINLHMLNNDRAAALRAYHACASVLQRELGVEPGSATREVYERLLNLESATTAPLEATFPLIGREREWAQLQVAWRAAAAGHAQLAVLIGEAGIGKTRLADELFRRIGRQGINSASAHCYPAEGTLAYAPVVAWLRARPVPNLEAVWLSELARLLPELSLQHPDLPTPGPLTEAWQRQRLHEALTRAVLGNGEPLLLWIEDLQWCDRDTLEWLHYLLRFDRQARMLIVATLRPEEVLSDHPVTTLLAALQHDRKLIEIAVGPLDAIGTQQLAAHVAGSDLDATRLACLYHETEGNPLFIIETLRANSDCAEPAALPPTVQAVITTRLAQLSSQVRELMELAATIGREFTFEILRQANDTDEETLIRGLDELWQRRIIREIGASAYDFSHGKLREVAYAGLSSARRRLLHRRVAEALVMVHANDVERVSAEVAAHYQQAGRSEQAVSYYRRAAIAAQRVYANEAALTYLSRAFALTPESALGERYDLLLARESVYHVQGQHEQQLRDILAVHALAQALNDQQRQAEVALRQAHYAEAVCDYPAAIEAAQTAIRLAQATPDARREAAGYLQWGQALWQHGDYDSARERLEQAFALAQAAHWPEVEANSLCNLAVIAEYQGDHLGARDRFGQALRLYRELGDRLGEFRAINNLGVASTSLGDRADARSYFEQAWRLSQEIGARRSESTVLRNLAGQAEYRSDYAMAHTCYEQSLQLCRATADRRGESETLTYLGLLFHHVGNHRLACEHSRRAAHIAQQIGAKYEQGLALTHLGHALLSLTQLDQAAAAYGQAITLRRAVGDLELVMEPLAGLAAVALAQGNLTQAQSYAEEIVTYLMSHTLYEVDEPFPVYLTCYRILRTEHDPRAATVLKMAYDLLQARAAQLPDEDARCAFVDNDPVLREIARAWHDLA